MTCPIAYGRQGLDGKPVQVWYNLGYPAQDVTKPYEKGLVDRLAMANYKQTQ